MEIVDEILTPGCPNCALKHLSAALAWLPVADAVGTTFCDDEEILRARAYVNFVEALEGYESHWYYGVGLLVRAEELSAMNRITGPALGVMRERRCEAMLASTPDERREALKRLVPTPASLLKAHLEEAVRELPCITPHYVKLLADGLKLVDVIISLIKWVKKEYFNNDFETKENEEKGEETMAMKKAPAKAAAKKAPAKKAAAKAPAKKAAAKKCAK